MLYSRGNLVQLISNSQIAWPQATDIFHEKHTGRYCYLHLALLVPVICQKPQVPTDEGTVIFIWRSSSVVQILNTSTGIFSAKADLRNLENNLLSNTYIVHTCMYVYTHLYKQIQTYRQTTKQTSNKHTFIQT